MKRVSTPFGRPRPKRQKAPAGAFWRSSLMHFYSGTPMHFYSGVDTVVRRTRHVLVRREPDTPPVSEPSPKPP